MELITLVIAATAGYENRIDELKSNIVNHYREKCDRVKYNRGKVEELLAGLLLKEYLGVTEDEQLVINEHGKPALSDNSGYFNLSHSDDYVVLAFGRIPLGVDIENKERLNWLIANKVFGEPQKEHLHQIEDNEPDKFPYYLGKYWTLYEAAIKLKGCGFAKKVDFTEIEQLQKFSYTVEHDKYVLSIVATEEFEVRLEWYH